MSNGICFNSDLKLYSSFEDCRACFFRSVVSSNLMNSKFIRYATTFLSAARASRSPNANWLAKRLDVSEKTASRIISRLRDDFGAPLEYDPLTRGYHLTDKHYTLPVIQVSDRDELAALLVARDLISTVDADDLVAAINRVWERVSPKSTQFGRDLELLAKKYSSDLTVVGDLVDRGVLDFVNASYVGENIELLYKSPWSHEEPVTLRGRIEHVHFSDGNLYLQFLAIDGYMRILNCSFIKEFNILAEDLEFASVQGSKNEENWLKGFGVWAGQELHMVTVEIFPPAAEYFAAQRWHDAQKDEWDGSVLVRTFPSMLSPELERRILSIGKFVRGVKPAQLEETITSQIKEMVKNFRIKND